MLMSLMSVLNILFGIFKRLFFPHSVDLAFKFTLAKQDQQGFSGMFYQKFSKLR